MTVFPLWGGWSYPAAFFMSLFKGRISVQAEHQNQFGELSEGHIMVGDFYLFRKKNPEYLFSALERLRYK